MPDAADARGDAALTFRLGLEVPTICRIEVRGAVMPAEGSAVTAEEFCNAPSGYRVVAVHPSTPGGARVWFDYGGRRVPANPSGMTTLAEEPTAAHQIRPFAVIYDRPGQSALANVMLQIVPR